MAGGGAKSPIPERPAAFVIDDDQTVRVAVSSALKGLGLTVATFDNANGALAAFDQWQPSIIFLDIALKQSDAVDVIAGLGKRHYTGILQLFSKNLRLLAPIHRIAARHNFTLRPPLPKPLGRETIAQVIAETGIGGCAAAAP